MSMSTEDIQSYRCRVCFACIALAEDQIASILEERQRVFIKCFNITVGDSSRYRNRDFTILGPDVNCSSCRSMLGYRVLRLEIPGIGSPEVGQCVMLRDQLDACRLRPASLP